MNRAVACSAQEAEELGLGLYVRTGCLLLHGTLGTVPVIVIVTLYVQKRMKQRDILEEELLELLARPISSHTRGKKQGRYEVAHRIEQRFLRAVYSHISPAVVLAVTVHQE